MKKLDYIIFYFIISLPIIDILTAFTASNLLSVGVVVRMAILAFLSTYIFLALLSNKSIYLYWYVLSLITIFTTLGLGLFIKQPFHFLEEAQFIFKTIYYVVIMFTVLILIKKRLHPAAIIRGAKIAAIIIGASFWIAFFTQSHLKSYAYEKAGFTGWFFSANELSIILLILLSLSIISLVKNADFSSFIAFLFTLSMTPMLGTKTAFYGALMLLFLYFIYVLFTPKQRWDIAVVSMIVVFSLALPYTPYLSNQGSSTNSKGASTTEVANENDVQALLSSRDVYLKNTIQDFKAAPWQQKLFGLGYGGTYTKAPKTIEMDFYDLFFSYGIVGAFLLVMPIYFISKDIIHIKKAFTYLFPLFTLGLCVGIAFVAGHMLFAPAVMSYVAILILFINVEAKTV